MTASEVPPGRRHPRRWRTVQARTAASATAVVAVALAALGVGLVLAQRTLLTDARIQVAGNEATVVAGRIASGDTTTANLFPRSSDESVLVQVLDQSGRVLVSSPSIDGEEPMTAVGSGDLRPSERITRLPFEDDELYALVLRPVTIGGAPGYVAAATRLAPVATATATTATVVGVTFPGLLVVVGLLAYRLAGRALRPVEEMRRHAAELSATNLSQRLAEPDTDDEIAHLASTLNAMLARLDAAAAGQRQFVSDASHELRSPLSTIRTTAEVALAYPRRADWPADAQVILAEAQRLQDLVDGLLLLARHDERGLVLNRRDIDLDQLVEEEATRLRTVCRHDVRIESSPVRVRGDRQALARALRNLVTNADRYARSRVEITLASTGTRARIEVRDDGSGIPADQLEAVFQRFVRLDPGRDRDAGGSGLGLPIARAVARAHGGDVVAVAAPPGRGAILVLEVPLDGADQPPSADHRAAAARER